VILAELEVFHSRPIAPTRRVAIGRQHLPLHPAPGFGGILLGGIAAAHIRGLDKDLVPDLHLLIDHVEYGRRIPQPRLRYRFQTDRIGLTKSRLRLLGDGESMTFDFDEKAAPAQYLLGAVYAGAALPFADRRAVLNAIRKGLRWQGPIDAGLIALLGGVRGPGAWSPAAFEDPVRWALDVLGFVNGTGGAIDRKRIQRRFREAARDAHPDHGGAAIGAAERLSDLAEARRILLETA
jgi:hypothetical protein